MADFNIVNGATGKVLDVPVANPANGVQIQQWDDLGNPQQQWQLVDVGNGLVKIVNGATRKVLDVPGADPANGVQIQQWDDLGNPQQAWRLAPLITVPNVIGLQPQKAVVKIQQAGLWSSEVTSDGNVDFPTVEYTNPVARAMVPAGTEVILYVKVPSRK